MLSRSSHTPSQAYFTDNLDGHFQNGGVHVAGGAIVTRTKRYHVALWTEKPDGTRKQEYIEPSTMTFAQFATEWLEKYPKLAHLKDSTWATYHSTVHRHLIPAFGSQRLTSIKAAAIEKDFKASLAVGRTPKTQGNILLVLRVMLMQKAGVRTLKSRLLGNPV